MNRATFSMKHYESALSRNIRKPLSRWLMASAVASIMGFAGVANAADVYLQTESYSKSITLPDASIVPVPMWRFICDPDAVSNPNCVSSASGSAQINVTTADILNVHLDNPLPVPVSIMIPGQAGGGNPVMMSSDTRRVQSFTAQAAAGATNFIYTWGSVASPLNPGTYLYQSGTNPSLQVPMGLHGALVVTVAGTAPVEAYPGKSYDNEAVLLFSEVDPVQNARVAAASASGAPSAACEKLADYNPVNPPAYPCTIDYNPIYFLINGETTASDLPAGGATSHDVLLRMLNAGLRTHTPALVGIELNLIAEDGNPYPGLTRQQATALLPAGKTLDAFVATPADNITLSLFDHMPTFNNKAATNGGSLATFMVGTGTPPPPAPTIYATDDIYGVTEDTALNAPSVLSNDTGLADATVTAVTQPMYGSLTMNGDGTFTYDPHLNFSGSDSFTYSASLGGQSYPATVTLNVSFENDAPVAAVDGPYVNAIGTDVTVDVAHGVLGNDSDPDGDALTAVIEGTAPAGLTLNPDGSFTYTGGSATSFSYRASDGSMQSDAVSVQINFNPVANITLHVQDPSGAAVDSYRWIVQEDATYNIDPAAPLAPSATLSTNFHKSYMPVVAQGCSDCFDSSKLLPGVDLTDPNFDPTDPANYEGNVVANNSVTFNQLALDPTKRYYVSVLPNDAVKRSGDGDGHSLGGAQILPGQTDVTVILNTQPIPTAQLSVIAFEDNNPTNGVPDPNESGLGGAQITLEDAGGRYGMSGGIMSQDAFGNPLKNSLDCFGGNPPPQGVILTCPDGTALIKDLPPGKFGVVIVPAEGTGNWTQTSTIEGTKLQDNWVKAGEPPFLVEFGAPGFHAFIGFVNPDSLTVPPGPPGQQNNTITGRVTMLHPERAPGANSFDSGSYDALSHTRAWVGLNSVAGDGPNIKTVQADENGNFSMDGIPDGTYQLVIWDTYLDQIIFYQTVILPGGGNVGNVAVPTWFGRHEHTVFLDANGNGVRDEGEVGMPDQNVNLRFRDGTVDQAFPTDTTGFVPFDQVFPYGSWQVAEIDYTRFKPTGVTVTVDGGGDVSGGPYPGLLNPQVGSPRTDTENPPVLLEGFQSMPGMTSLFEWGKKPYEPGENGGIAGIVYYASTRGENNPRLTAGDPWEPGIPHVKVRLYREVAKSDGSTGLSLVQEVETDSWDDHIPTGCEGETAGNPFVTDTLAGDRTHCFDGVRNFEQVRPGAVFDGGYAFTGIDPGKYVVEVVPPPGYELYKEEDKNVDFGDAFGDGLGTAPVSITLPNGMLTYIIPDQAMIEEAKGFQVGLAQPPCVGQYHLVPPELTLFPGIEAPFRDAYRPLCDRKEVVLSDQGQSAADFHLFTKTPVAAQFAGLATDDIAVETNPASPSFGDKWGPAFIPVSMRDFKGQEIYRTYTDAFGRYNGMVPSTFSANLPIPSGYSPGMHFVCLNDPGPLPNGQLDPNRNPAYGNFCYTLMYMPGTTTYPDTPLLPNAAFAAGFNPVDCALSDATPVIKEVNGTGVGPLVAPGGSFTIDSQGMTLVPNPAYEGPLATNGELATVQRNYGFGASGVVTLNGTAISCGTWTDAQITCTAPGTAGSYQLVVTSSNGNSSVNAVTLTVSTETPKRVPSVAYPTIQDAIDGATNGDLILVGPGTYEEMVIMWKPVRLQGSGAATFLNAIKRPTEKLGAWRTKIKGLLDAGDFDLLPGQPGPDFNIVGGGLFGTELGAGITVVAKNDTSYENNPARIDGFTITGADGGGGIFVNGYAHNLQISNNYVTANSGVLHGGIRVGHPSLPLVGDGPFDFNRNLDIHNNMITLNGAQSDFGVGGGLALNTGTDNYAVSHNFICGNFNLGDGGGIGHQGLSTPGRIDFNKIVFNQSFNQGQNASGGGILIAGELPAVGALTLGAGNVSIDANLIQGNQAATGHGGGIRTQYVNGRDVELNPIPAQFNNWYAVRMTNNMIVNNVAGWSGGGISLQDTVNGVIVLNTVANNDTTGTVAAVLTSGPQPAGISSERHSLALDAVIPGLAVAKQNFSNPTLTHNIVWRNRAFTYDASTGTPRLLPVLTPAAVGGCPGGANYVDLGVLDPGFNLNPQFNILTSGSGTNVSADPQFLTEYCNGGRSLTTLGPIQVVADVAEGGNFIDVRYGPLTQAWQGNGPWNYHIMTTSPAINRNVLQPSGENVNHDYDNQVRPSPAQGGPAAQRRRDWGADEVR